jgi:hypothetical protein
MVETKIRTRRAGGRPRKFREPSAPVTVTLPDRTLEQLRSIDEDRAKAIVKAVDAVMGTGSGPARAVEVIEMAPGTGVVVIPPTRSLATIPWLNMIEIAPARHLLTIVPGTAIEKVEVGLLDLLEDAKSSAPHEVPTLEALVEKIRGLRRGKKISVAEILFVAV